MKAFLLISSIFISTLILIELKNHTMIYLIKRDGNIIIQSLENYKSVNGDYPVGNELPSEFRDYISSGQPIKLTTWNYSYGLGENKDSFVIRSPIFFTRTSLIYSSGNNEWSVFYH